MASFPFGVASRRGRGARARRRLAEERPGAKPDGRDPRVAGVGPPRSPLPARALPPPPPVTSAPRSLGALWRSGDEPGPGCRASLPTLPLRKWCATLAGVEAGAAAALGELLFTGGVGRAAELSPAAGPGERRQPSGRQPRVSNRCPVRVRVLGGGCLLTCSVRHVNLFEIPSVCTLSPGTLPLCPPPPRNLVNSPRAMCQILCKCSFPGPFQMHSLNGVRD